MAEGRDSCPQDGHHLTKLSVSICDLRPIIDSRTLKKEPNRDLSSVIRSVTQCGGVRDLFNSKNARAVRSVNVVLRSLGMV